METSVTSKDYEIEKVEFYIDNTLRSTDITEPYSWTWNNLAFFRHTVKVVAYNTADHNSTREFTMWKFF
ncbi:MAG: Ig-like domain-containing protein [Euryarchaeota archaeon]|nr:Ig-like domain-containing protein [Euryarchaeota archaeon]